MSTIEPSDPRLISYMSLRRAVEAIGILLPLVLAGLNMLFGWAVVLQGSISGYYYTAARGVLVGSLCAIGVFLFTYRGYDRRDDVLTNAAGLFAIGVALFPTAPPNPSSWSTVAGYVHACCAVLLFGVLAAIALWQFTRTERNAKKTAQKNKRDRV